MADFDEELKRQAAISSLLARDDSGDSYAASMAPEVIQPDTQADYHKLINQAFDTKTDEQVVAQPDQGQPDKKYDTVTAESVVPYGEAAPSPLAKSDYAPKDTGKGAAPEDYPTIAQDQGGIEQAPDALNQVERASLVKLPPQVRRAELVDPDPDRNYFELNKADRDPSIALLRDQPVPGFVESSQNAILNPAVGVMPPKPVPRAQPAAPRADIVQDPIVTRSIATNMAAQSAPAPVQGQAPVAPAAPAPTSSEVTQPASNDDYNKLMDSVFPSAKTAGDSIDSSNNDLSKLRNQLSQELNDNPDLRRKLMASIQAEVGDQGEEAKLAYTESVFNRAIARGQTLDQTISDRHYYPITTTSKLNRSISRDEFNYLNPVIDRVLGGSNITQFATGNESGNVHSGGAQVTYNPQTGERFVLENPDVGWNKNITAQTVAPAQNKMPWDNWTPLSPADQAAAEKEGQEFRTQQVSSLDKLNRATPNPKQFWETLQNPIEGVTDSQRQAYAENFKKEVTAHAQDFYGEKDPEKAFTKAISDPGFDAYITNIGRGLAGAVGQADIGIALAGKSIDRNRVDGFMNLVHPDSTGEGRAAFLKNLTDIHNKFEGNRLDDPGLRQRHDLFNQIYSDLPQTTKDAIGDPASILDSIDHLANPAEQADLNKRISIKKAWVDQQLAGSPELKGAPGIWTADWWTTGTGENLFNTVAALVPGGVGAVVRTSTLGAQMYSANMDRIAQEHPDYSPEQVSEEASKSAFMTLAPQEAVLAASHGLTAPILKWAGSLAEKPIVRFGIGGGVQVAAAGVGGALGQVGTNVAENKPILQDVPQAAGSAVVQSLPFAVHGGLGALGHEVAPAEPTRAAEALPPTHVTEPTDPQAKAVEDLLAQYRQTETEAPSHQEQKPQAPQNLAEAIRQQKAAADLGETPPPSSQARTDFPTPAHETVYNDLVARGMDEARARDYVNQARGATQAEILADVQTQMRGAPPPPRVSESEPFTSKIANRYTAERMATGELGHIDPSQGKSTEELVKQGMQMAPDQRERMINNFTRGVGGDLDNQGAAIRSKEAMLSVQSTEASRASEADPTNAQLKANADAASKAATDFHNGPLKKLKRVWSDAGRGLMREIPLDYTTLNGMKEAYVKGAGNGKEAPPEMEPKLKQTAARVRKSAVDEEAALNGLGKEIEKRTRGKALPSDDSIRAKLMKIMGDLPCRN